MTMLDSSEYLLDYKNPDPISQLPFLINLSKIEWPFSPEQLPPLIPKQKFQIAEVDPNVIQCQPHENQMSPSKKSQHIQRQSSVSYEKCRMNRLVRQIENFKFERSQPFIWMQNNFGKAITQKEFNKIYRELKEVLPPEKAPNRDVNRNQKLRFKWMNDIWDDNVSRHVLQALITKVMAFSR